MKVLLTTAGNFPLEWTPLADFQSLAARDRFGVHTLTESAAEADVILFVDAHMPHDWTLAAIRHHPLVRRFPEKTLIYDDRDRPWCALPGLYVSMPKSGFDPRRQIAVPYYKNHNEHVAPEEAAEPDLLFSFMGGRRHKVRDRLLDLTHPRAHIEDTSHTDFFDLSDGRDEQRIQAQKCRYREVLRRSKFVLCPRGTGASSFRLQETLTVGRVPVIISDEWVPPVGIDWEGCAIRVRESEVGTIPALLESREADFPVLSARARQAYQDWLAPDVFFHRTVEHCRTLLESGACVRRRPLLDRQYLRLAASNKRSEARKWLGAAERQMGRGGA